MAKVQITRKAELVKIDMAHSTSQGVCGPRLEKSKPLD